MFTDLVDFTELASNTPLDDLLRVLTTVYTQFDRLAEKHGALKLEIIGDAFICVAGLDGESDHGTRMVRLALAMQDAMRGLRTCNGVPVRMRAAVHCGAAWGGVFGVRQFRYELWGAAYYAANKLESCGVAGRVVVSEECFDTLDHDRFVRGRALDVRNVAPSIGRAFVVSASALEIVEQETEQAALMAKLGEYGVTLNESARYYVLACGGTTSRPGDAPCTFATINVCASGDPNRAVVGVFAGLRGSRCVQHTAQSLPAVVGTDSRFMFDPCAAMRRAGLAVQESWAALYPNDSSGCTYALVHVSHSLVVVSVLGDVSVSIFRRGVCSSLVAAHTLERASERERVANRDVHLWDDRKLAPDVPVTRAVGLNTLNDRRALSHTPETLLFSLDHELSFILLANTVFLNAYPADEASAYISHKLLCETLTISEIVDDLLATALERSTSSTRGRKKTRRRSSVPDTHSSLFHATALQSMAVAVMAFRHKRTTSATL